MTTFPTASICSLWKTKYSSSVGIGDTPVQLIVDSSVIANILDNETFSRLYHLNCSTTTAPLQLVPSSVKLFTYGSNTPLHFQGSFIDVIKDENMETTATFTVGQAENSGSLMGRPTAVDLAMVTAFTSSTIQYSLKKATTTHYFISILGLSKREKTQQFQLKLHINNWIRYIAQPSRRLSFRVCRRRKIS